ncbi:hypothetical protein [Kordiimonas sp.]|uniref:hypothetical protein n=1 Tax=Kordiimonas sp. TaxID=1970157 RepID=UPI003A93CD7D
MAKSQIILIELLEGTSGQGETVVRGLERLSIVDKDTEPLVIFNVDTAYQEPVSFNIAELEHANGLLDVFIGDGESWSFVEPFNDNDQVGPVRRVVEKERISSLCCTGMYWFKSLRTFQLAFDEYYDSNHSLFDGETYVAPIYQKMIEQNSNSVIYRQVEREKLDFFGTPSEYEDYVSKLGAVVGGFNA